MTYILFIQNSFYSPLPSSILIFILLLFTCWRHDRCHSSRYPLDSKQQRRKKGWQKGISESLLSLFITEGKKFLASLQQFSADILLVKITSLIGHPQLGCSFLAARKSGKISGKGQCVGHDLLRPITMHPFVLNTSSS